MEKGNEVATGGPQAMQATGGPGAAGANSGTAPAPGTGSGTEAAPANAQSSGGQQADQTKERERPGGEKVTLPDGSTAQLDENGRWQYSDRSGNPMAEPDEETPEQHRLMGEWLDTQAAKLDEWADFGERFAQLDPNRAELARQLANGRRFEANDQRKTAAKLNPPPLR